MTEATARKEIGEYIASNGGISDGYGWYVGITDDPARRLFEEHRVDKEEGGPWIYRWVASDRAARRIEEHFIHKGCTGGSGGGDSDSKCVYAYKITLETKE